VLEGLVLSEGLLSVLKNGFRVVYMRCVMVVFTLET